MHPLIRSKFIAVLVSGFILGWSSSVLADEDVALLSSKIFLPLVNQSIKSLENNPTYFPHGMGMESAADIARWLHRQDKMKAFERIPLETNWDQLDKKTQALFKSLVDQSRSKICCVGNAKLAELWKRARANPNLDVMCCGNGCMFTFKHRVDGELQRLMLDSYENSKSCVLRWGSNSPTPVQFARDKKLKKLGYRIIRSWQDPGCKGSLKKIDGSKLEASQQLKNRYQILLNRLNPKKTLVRSGNSQCDV